MGALTSKPYAFRARPWELKTIDSFDFTTASATPIRLNVRSGQVMRILPRPNSHGGETFIGDRIRFLGDSFKRQRLAVPYSRTNGSWMPVYWKQSFNVFASNFDPETDQINGLVGDFVPFNDQLTFSTFLSNANNNREVSFFNDVSPVPVFEHFSSHLPVHDLRTLVIVLNSSLHREYPDIHAALARRYKTREDIGLIYFGSKNLNPFINAGPLESFLDFVTLKHVLSSIINSYDHFIIYDGTHNKGQINVISNIAKHFKTTLESISKTCVLIKLKPINVIQGRYSSLKISNSLVGQKSRVNRVLYLLEADAVRTNNSFKFIVYHGTHGTGVASVADLIFPSFMRYEDKRAYNYRSDGTLVRFLYAVNAPLEARSTQAILKYLEQFLHLNAFSIDLPIFKKLSSTSFVSSISQPVLSISQTYQNLYDYYSPDVISRASITLSLAAARFYKLALVRNNFYHV